MKNKKKIILAAAAIILIVVLILLLKPSHAFVEIRNTISQAENGFSIDQVENIRSAADLQHKVKSWERDSEYCKSIHYYHCAANGLEAISEIGAQFGVHDFFCSGYRVENNTKIPQYSSEEFGRLDDSSKLNLIIQMEVKTEEGGNYPDYFEIKNGDDCYMSTVDDGEAILLKNLNRVYSEENEYSLQVQERVNAYLKGAQSSDDVCPVCNGTGFIRYYYGSSALEAALNGHDDYEDLPCYNCNQK